MGNSTVQVKHALEREKAFSARETLEYLHTRENFRFVSETIKELLNQRGVSGDDEQLVKAFRKLMREKGVFSNSSKFASAENWFKDMAFPSKISAIKMCFAFDLSSRTRPTALDFLWNTCQVNGFNFRRADEVVFYYALERGKSYSYAVDLLNRYEKETAGVIIEDSYETKSTDELCEAFSELDIMPDDEFFETLCENKKNFIGYRKNAHVEFVKIYDGLTALIAGDIKENNIDNMNAKIPGYGKRPVNVFSELVFDKTLHSITAIRGNTDKKRSVLIDITENFPLAERIKLLYEGTKNEESAAKNDDYEKEYGFDRKVFILCFFAKYVIEWERYLADIKVKAEPPKKFYTDFYRRLNSSLNKCTYALLYPRNPFDWLILNCVRSLDSSDQDRDLDALDLFNETLSLFVNEQ